MFPYELKQNLEDFISTSSGFLKSAKEFYELPKQPNVQDYESIVDTIYEVLYKFSYLKMKTFCKVPELACIYIMFYETLDENSETYYNVAKEIKDYCF